MKQFQMNWDVLTLEKEAQEIARQMTLMEQKIYFAIETTEFLNCAWTKDSVKTPNLDKYVAWTNRISNWITREILVQPMPTMQAKAITLFVDVGMHLLIMHNFNGLNQVLAALQGPAICKLKKANLVCCGEIPRRKTDA